jgi:hypothetical protein
VPFCSGFTQYCFPEEVVPERIEWPKILSKRGGSYSSKNCTKHDNLFERRTVGQQDTPNLVKPMTGKKVPERHYDLRPFEKRVSGAATRRVPS